jgi:hypothetical protein
MALLMLLAFSVVISSRVPVHRRTLAAAIFAVMGVGIAASGSRGPVAHLLLAAAVGIAFTPGVLRRLSVGFSAVVMTGLAVVLAGFLIGSVLTERFSTLFDPETVSGKLFGPFSYGIRIGLDHFFGMGLGYTAGVPQFITNPVFRDLPTTNIDSGYGSAAAELGLLGLGLFTYLALKVGVEGFRTWKRLPAGRLRDLLLGPALIAATYPLVSLVYQPQAVLPSSIYSWLLIGILMKAPALQRASDADHLRRTPVHSGE